MTQAANQVLTAFDSLPLRDRHEVAAELLRRTLSGSEPEISDEALVGIADELFQVLDAEEAEDDKSQTG